MSIENLIIKTGYAYTLVTVDPRNAECRVALAVPRETASPCRNATSTRVLTVEGVGDNSIRKAARDGAGRSYRSITSLFAEQDAGFTATRRADLDC
jgi:hypothetical protein